MSNEVELNDDDMAITRKLADVGKVIGDMPRGGQMGALLHFLGALQGLGALGEIRKISEWAQSTANDMLRAELKQPPPDIQPESEQERLWKHIETGVSIAERLVKARAWQSAEVCLRQLVTLSQIALKVRAGMSVPQTLIDKFEKFDGRPGSGPKLEVVPTSQTDVDLEWPDEISLD